MSSGQARGHTPAGQGLHWALLASATLPDEQAVHDVAAPPAKDPGLQGVQPALLGVARNVPGVQAATALAFTFLYPGLFTMQEVAPATG